MVTCKLFVHVRLCMLKLKKMKIMSNDIQQIQKKTLATLQCTKEMLDLVEQCERLGKACKL